MTKSLSLLLRLIAVLSIVPAAFWANDSVSYKTVIGPDILVSHDGDVPHFEIMAASNPRNAKDVLAGSITYARAGGGQNCKAYFSTDGGYTWSDHSFPEQVSYGGGDPQVAFTLQGTALLTGLTFAPRPDGKSTGYLHVWRSGDAGATWDSPANLGYSYDHEQIVVDHSFGHYAGRIYLAAAYVRQYPRYEVGIFRSDDDGRTFVGPVPYIDGRGVEGIAGGNLLLFSDGVLFAPYLTWPIDAKQREKFVATPFFFVTSNDGGLTFSTPTKIGEQYFGGSAQAIAERKQGVWTAYNMPVFAVDANSVAFHDRLYAAWVDLRSGSPRILFSYSADRGRTWSDPKMISSTLPGSASQSQAAMIVNRDGVVGVTWFDTRNSSKEDSYDEYFAASADGGQSFLPAVRVSSQSSFPAGIGNQRPTLWGIERGEDAIEFRMTSNFSFRPGGGDYMGLSTDTDGTFHPVWVDSRTGTSQIWTARINVVLQKAPGSDSAAPMRSRVRSDLTADLDFVFDPADYSPSSRELSVPIRLRNRSKRDLYGPFTVELEDTLHPSSKALNQAIHPQVLNSTNGKSGEGAIIDYSTVLRDLESLPPGGISAPVVWKIKIAEPIMSDFLYMKARVFGFLEGPNK